MNLDPPQNHEKNIQGIFLKELPPLLVNPEQAPLAASQKTRDQAHLSPTHEVLCRPYLQRTLSIEPLSSNEFTQDEFYQFQKCILHKGWQLLNLHQWQKAFTLFEVYFEIPYPSPEKQLAYIYLGMAQAQFQLENHTQAQEFSEKALDFEENLASAYGLLAQISYADSSLLESLDHLDFAIYFSKHDGEKESFLSFREKILKEVDIEKHFLEKKSLHFNLKYKPEIPENIANEIIKEAEEAYALLISYLGFAPQRMITILIYDQGQYTKITHGPQWSNGIYDGKIRIPLPKIQMNPILHQTILHETCHAFFHQGYNRAFPTWVEEGFAQFISLGSEVGKSNDPDFFDSSENSFSFAELESSFIDLSRKDAQKAYFQAWNTVIFLYRLGGKSAFRRFLEELSQGKNTQKALNLVYNRRLEDLEKEIAFFVSERSGEL